MRPPNHATRDPPAPHIPEQHAYTFERVRTAPQQRLMTNSRQVTDPRGPTSSHTAGENASRHRLRRWWPSDAQTTSQPAQSCVRRPTVTKGMADGSAATPAGQLGLEAAQHAACRSHHRPTSALKSSWRTNETINLQRRGRESSAWGTDSTLRRYERNRTDGTAAMWANSGYQAFCGQIG